MTKTERTIMTVGDDGRVVTIRVIAEVANADTSKWLWGWKEIGAAVNRSEKWGQRRAKLIPVSWVEGRPGITLLDLYQWVKSQRTPTRRTNKDE